MKALCAKITFEASRGREAIVLRKPTSVIVEKSWKMLTDTAIITIARNVRDFDKQKVRDVFRPGDPVKIELGYDGEYYEEFVGFISRVSADIPIKIWCEDAMWKLKQQPVNISKPSTTLKALMDEVVTDYTIDAAEYEIGPARYPQKTVALVLDDLKKRFGFFSYMKGEKLVVGKIYADDTGTPPVDLHLEKQVYSNNLEYQFADDVIVKVFVESTLSNGKKLKAEVGEDGGDVIRVPHFGIKDEETLKKLAKVDYDKYKVNRYKGGITTFGIPAIEHGWKVNLSSDLYPDREGLYYVDSIKVSFGEGYRYARTATLGDVAQ
ncbi:MAG: hypothetical protein JJE55_06845 [Flavobacteriaceae bacterium]|nr:hypothetical protein [Flavobacteriaceae bacterium]